VLLRSIFPTATGAQTAQTPSFVTGHQSPWNERWGGWYVTGTHGSHADMGNALVLDRERPEELNRATAANLLDLSNRFDTAAYLTGDSDIVAHLVLAHQTQAHNLITLTNYQTRLALYAEAARNTAVEQTGTALSNAAREQYERPAEELVRYLLFADETALDGPVKGTSTFATDFAARGIRDGRGRSLRDFDLRTRIFQYPCSYLIYSDDFDALPEPARGYVYRRLLEVLTGRDRTPAFAKLTATDRQAILEILLATKKGLPADWKAYDKRS
jgi:hypothetical protein